ncbi:MAG: sigma-70 family RNA polymerase sigma factor [Acidobacteria bacterium]|nr:sigma-70 family RNA polymerase sigma factor [Acidobacteriota bacterium]MBI3425867.1 sigma-70 family RNA polymerase sigma factor [Acidobacteriota bacterium]
MLAEKEALLIAGIEKLRQVEVAEDAAPRSAVVCLQDTRLIARLKTGELAAFEELVEEFQPLVYVLCYRVLNDSEDARDAAQETFLKIYRHFSHFRGEASLKTWICRIAINQARSSERWWRRRYRKETVSLDAPVNWQRGQGDEAEQAPSEYLPSADASPETEALASERGRQLEHALTGLKKDFRIAVVLRDIEGLAYEEIAYVTGANVGTVKSRIARGREMLREAIEKQK